MGMTMTMEDVKRVKGMGFLFNRESADAFSARVITGNGTMTAAQLIAVSKAAEKFGNGLVSFTTRMTIELAGVHYDDIPALQSFLGENGLYTGGTGDRLRPVVSCKGTTCVFGQIDTQAVAQAIHVRFFEGWKDIELPHKFKVAVGGCPNNCVKPDLNDFGLVGANVPSIDFDVCRGCKKCAVTAICQMDAPRMADGKISIDREKCNFCGKCIQACYFHCLQSERHGVKVLLGGKWGRKRRPATMLEGVYSVEEALDLLEKALLVFRKHAFKKERFGDMIDRVGFPAVERELSGETMMLERESVLAAKINMRPVTAE